MRMLKQVAQSLVGLIMLSPVCYAIEELARYETAVRQTGRSIGPYLLISTSGLGTQRCSTKEGKNVLQKVGVKVLRKASSLNSDHCVPRHDGLT